MNCVCPLCNSLATYVLKCDNCGGQMENQGSIQDFFDDYSPYLPMDITQRIDGVVKEKCVHLFACTNCHSDKRHIINKVLI